jgi:branched-chain amino acid transport system permease protein
MIKDRTLLGLTLALAVLLAGVAVFPHWLAFLVMVSLARGLVVLGLVLQMRAGLVSFGQGLYYCIGGYAACSAVSMASMR